MKNSVELRQERQAEINAQKKIMEDAKDDKGVKRSLNEDEATRFDAAQAKIDSLNVEIKRAEAFEKNQRDAAGIAGNPLPGDKGDDDGEEKEKRKMKKRFSMTKAMRGAMPNNGQDGVEKEIFDIAKEEARLSGAAIPENAGFALPSEMMRADIQSVTLDSAEYGGQLVQDDNLILVEGFMPKLWAEGMGGTMLSGLSGGDVPLPVTENYELEWLDEDESNTPTKGKFVGPKLTPRRASRTVGISNRLLKQSSISVDNLITRKLGEGAARAFERAYINGDNANKEPQGILNTVGILEVTQAAADPTWDNVVELQGLLESNDATEQSLGYLLSPLLKSKLMTTKKDSGSGIMVLDNPNNLAGFKYRSTTLVPILTGNHVLIYGDFAQLFMGMWGGASFIVDPYTQAGKDNVAIHVNIYGDSVIANPKAFAVNKFLTV
ncbi:MAG: phage major capsid protein [Bacteroidota bacterium]